MRDCWLQSRSIPGGEGTEQATWPPLPFCPRVVLKKQVLILIVWPRKGEVVGMRLLLTRCRQGGDGQTCEHEGI